jgi:hypothetical protein
VLASFDVGTLAPSAGKGLRNDRALVGSAGRSGFRELVNEVLGLVAVHLVYGEAGERADTA